MRDGKLSAVSEEFPSIHFVPGQNEKVQIKVNLRTHSQRAAAMQHIGLALSGGGFRATLYHLGVVRFMRDAQLLRNVTHITSVSGGSILGAHLALNWDRYCGTTEQFETAAQELIRFVQLDIRNRIVRRVPFASAINFAKSLMWMSQTRQLTRAGLLEKQYEQFLFGDVRLSQLPESPRLHMLATNLSEGCLCAFHRNGLTKTQRISGKSMHQVSMGLATVPMAVAASSAFPGSSRRWNSMHGTQAQTRVSSVGKVSRTAGSTTTLDCECSDTLNSRLTRHFTG